MQDGRDSIGVMMAAAVEDGGGGQQRQRRTTAAADDNRMQDWAADYEGDELEGAARDSGDMEWQ